MKKRRSRWCTVGVAAHGDVAAAPTKPLFMEHYICPGTCGTVSDEQHTCQNLQCPRYGQMLELCTCTDDRHGREINSEEYKKLDKEWEV